MKNRVTGIGGIFFKSKDPKTTKDWYSKHLGLTTDQYGSTFWWKDKEGNDCSTQWSPMKDDTDYYEPSKKEFMINYRVENLEELLEELKKEGVEIVGRCRLSTTGNSAGSWIPMAIRSNSGSRMIRPFYSFPS